MRVFAATIVTWTLLLAPTVLLLLAADAAGGKGPSVLLPEGNCTTMCGDVVVPYPFGTTAGCYLPGFNLTCNTSHEPPLLFLGNGTLQVVGISLEKSTVHIVGPHIHMVESVGTDYVATGTWGGPAWGLSDEGPYILSREYNELVLFGCPFFAELVMPSDRDQVINTCGSICSGGSWDSYGDECWEQPNSRLCKCSGIGCCQVIIPNGRMAYNVRLKTLQDVTDVSLFHYSVFISEEGWFRQSNASWSSLSVIPAVLAWAIVSNALPYTSDELRDGNATCPKDLGSTACHSSYSTCKNIGRPYGKHLNSYTCSCWHGYQGNPYLPDGCQGP
nr:unnamed protein product [Digitaria exilis]